MWIISGFKLESPQEIAAQIKETSQQNIEYGQGSQRKNIAYPQPYHGNSNTGQKNSNSNAYNKEQRKKNPYESRSNYAARVILIIILLAFP